MKNILCILSFHDWEYTTAAYKSTQEERLGIPSKEATRTCQRCLEKQDRYEHCLGLNPPEYIYTWTKTD